MDGSIKKQPEQPKETILVKRGFFYYLGQLLIFPFKVLERGASISIGYMDIYSGWIKESKAISSKRKKLNKMLYAKQDEEII